MAFRSHLARPLDIRQRSNLVVVALVGALAMIALVGALAVIALVRWLDGEPPDVFTAPVHCYLIWAVLREIDPDHNWTALAGGAVAGAWVLAGGPGISLWLLVGLILGARITTATTGRRPLPTDLAVVAVVAVAIGFRPEGWAAGFGLAVAVYLDERFSGANRHWVSALAAAMAVATTVVANLADAFGDTAPEVIPWVALAAGVVALALLVREPAVPVSQVDARHSAFMDQGRLHTSRAMVGFVVFVATVLAGTAAEGMVPVLVALGLAVLSNEVEVIFRRRSG